MRITRGQKNLSTIARPCVATIGNFDGVHLGHLRVIQHVIDKAATLKMPSTLILFEPHPQEYFRSTQAPTRLSTFREKAQLIREVGIEHLICLRFDASLSQMLPEHFVQELLINRMGVNHLVVGDDFRFGRGRLGDFELLKTFEDNHVFSVEATATFKNARQRVSSTRIRHCLAAAEFDTAARLLTRPYSISGRVGHGKKLGQKLGFRTLNLPTRRLSCPLHGVYVVQVANLSERLEPAVANVGTRPTVDGQEFLLEVHLLEAEGDFYGQRVEVIFRKKLREEMRFAGLVELKAAIGQDVEDSKQYFKQINLVQSDSDK